MLRLRGFVRDRRGTILAEWALAMPVIVVILLGGFEVARFALLQQKLDRLATTVGDIVAQAETMTAAEMDRIFAATSTIMAPFAVGDRGRVIVSSIMASSGQPARVLWQRGGGGTLAETSEMGAAGTNALLPAGFVVRDGESVIVAETYYDFTPMFAPVLVPARRLYHRAMFRPRFGALTTLN